MSDESLDEEKTEEGSEKKKRESLEKGHVLRSKELTTTFVLLTSSSLLLINGEGMTQRLLQTLKQMLVIERSAIFDHYFMFKQMLNGLEIFLFILLPFFLVLIIAAVGSTGIFGGIHLHFNLLAPNWGRMSLFKGLGRMMSLNILIELGKSIVKFLIVAGFGFLLLKTKLPLLFTVDQKTLSQALMLSANILAWAFFSLSAALLIVSCFDVPFQWFKHQKEIRMTKDEVRKESKETEGSPELKQHIRQRQHEVARRRMMSAIPEADVVITNPTHYAVALKYDQKKKRAPVVVARGKNLIALQIREVAEKNKVAVLEVPPLARAVYFATKLDQEIPFGLYVAVAQVLAYVYQLKTNTKGYGKKPTPLGEIIIPPEYRK